MMRLHAECMDSREGCKLCFQRVCDNNKTMDTRWNLSHTLSISRGTLVSNLLVSNLN